MRLVIHDYGGYPFSAQLARELARRGHEVTYVHATGFRSPKACGQQSPIRIRASLEMRGIDIGEPFRRRRFHSTDAPGTSVRPPGVRRNPRSSTGTRDLRKLPARCPVDHPEGDARCRRRIRLLAPGPVLPRRRPPAGSAAAVPGDASSALDMDGLNGICCGPRTRRSPSATTSSRPCREWGVPTDRTMVVNNWAPLQAGAPMDRAMRGRRSTASWSGPALLYAGTLGRKHDPDSCSSLADAPPIATVVVVADGVGADWLRRQPSAAAT